MADHAEEFEKLFRKLFKKLWFEQMDVAIEQYPITQDTIDVEASANLWDESFAPMITEIYEGAFELATEGGVLAPAHRQYEGLNPAALEWIATRSLSLAQMVNGTTKKELRKVLATGFEEGESIPQLTKRIEKYYKNGYERRATMVARTEVIAASNEGAIQSYENEGVIRTEFYASLDERICVECEGLHGTVFPISGSHGVIPVHPDCRCTWIPLLD